MQAASRQRRIRVDLEDLSSTERAARSCRAPLGRSPASVAGFADRGAMRPGDAVPHRARRMALARFRIRDIHR